MRFFSTQIFFGTSIRSRAFSYSTSIALSSTSSGRWTELMKEPFTHSFQRRLPGTLCRRMSPKRWHALSSPHYSPKFKLESCRKETMGYVRACDVMTGGIGRVCERDVSDPIQAGAFISNKTQQN